MTVPLLAPCSYDQFRCGLTFADVAQELRREQRQALDMEGRRMFITRRTVLGRMHQHKETAYRDYRRWHRPECAA